MKKISILVVDDEQAQLQSISGFLSRRDYGIFTAENGKEAFEILKNNLVDIILTDYRMPEWDGLQLLKNVKQFNPEIEVIVMTAFGSIEDAVTLLKEGAYDYITKPIELDELESILSRVKERKELIRENKILKQQLAEKFEYDEIITQSSKMEDILNTSARVANSKATCLIRGESGTGKELIAKAIHHLSPLKDKPFVVVNIASLSENLIESELFGHEKGSFTGAITHRIGRFEEADGGTLFIDEIGEIPPYIQVKLLRAIQFNEVQRIGSNKTLKVDVRIIAATNRNLEEMIKQKIFREDLYYRLNVVTINLPPLRERKEDIPKLIETFTKKYAIKNGKDILGLTKEAMDKMMKYDYPGNIRELQNIIERAVILSRTEYIIEEDLPFKSEKRVSSDLLDPLLLEHNYKEKMKAFEKEMLVKVLEQTNGNKSAAARLLGITERHLRSRLQILNMK
ncbi:MAG: sigma-54-dependent Fis family transcriptional regulator [Ignavibacteriales bacterium]|nr:sigma-54-dependent Fis family transcriptional regulator [Ignavibacteriales bacterium]